MFVTVSTAGLCVGAANGGAQAQDQTFVFDMPQQSLSASLRDYARVSGQQIIFTDDLVAGYTGKPLHGAYSPAAALSQLLAGTGLIAERSSLGALMIRREQHSAVDAPANAQVQAQGQSGAGGAEQVVVSASRISIAGYQAATPVTVIDAATIERDAKVNIGDSIRELPAVGISDSLSNAARNANSGPGDALLDTVSLRSLGTARTLVLFDGQRVVTSNPSNGSAGGGGGAIGTGGGGGVDLSTLPTMLIERVDVVTGGASAAWGSDAIAGVVNLVLNKKFEGFKANAQFGDTDKDDRRVYKIELAAGTAFNGDRGHLLLSVQHTMSPDAVFVSQRDWWNPQALFPAGQSPTKSFGSCGGGTAASPMCVHTNVNGNSAFTQGGLITASVAGAGTVGVGGVTALAPANALKGLAFGPNGTFVPFQFGTTFASNCYNCSATKYSSNWQYTTDAQPYHNTALFGYASYKLTDDIKASIQLNFGTNYGKIDNPRVTNVTVKPDNAYLDPVLAAQMVAGGIPSLTVSSTNTVNLPIANTIIPSFATLQQGFGEGVTLTQRQMMRGVFTLEGALGNDWSWNAYAQHSEVRERMHLTNNLLTPNYNNAVDAVRVTAAGSNSVTPAAAAALVAAGAPVPQVGSIACRSSLTATSWGVIPPATPGGQPKMSAGGLSPLCVPLDVFGTNVASQEAINYVAPGFTNPGIANQVSFVMQETVFSGSAQGVLPWGLPAGRVAVAFGGEYRLEQQTDIRDPLQIGAIPAWGGGNFAQFSGAYNVKEGFLEVNAPLLKDDIVQSLDFNAAGRYTSYSTSGDVQTWKLGLTSQVNDDIRLRASWSVDIRAPFISELFTSQPPQFNVPTAPDPHNGNAQTSITATVQGNPNLKPENAVTVSGGVVLTPHWIEGLTLSMDWYSINIKSAIFIASTLQVIQSCTAGSQQACSNIFFGRGPGGGALATSEVDGNGVTRTDVGKFALQADGALNLVVGAPLNVASETTSGLDFQADYRMNLFNGLLDWHILSNYNDERTITKLGVTYDGAGSVGLDSPIIAGPKFHTTLAATYSEGQWTGTVQGRIIGSARLVNTWVEGVNVDNNAVPAIAYADLRLSYNWTDGVNLYGAVDNVFDTPPPSIPSSVGINTTNQNFNLQIYDGLGRQFRVGLRFAY
jgi:outer membrane receptor protein involved in Fe transport